MQHTDFVGDVDMNWVWKLKGLSAGLAGVMATAEMLPPSSAIESDILLDGRRGEATKSGLRKPLSRDRYRSSMSFQLLW